MKGVKVILEAPCHVFPEIVNPLNGGAVGADTDVATVISIVVAAQACAPSETGITEYTPEYAVVVGEKVVVFAVVLALVPYPDGPLQV